jgi:hypothetical protein
MQRKGVYALSSVHDFFTKHCNYSLIILLSIVNAITTMSKHDVSVFHMLTIKSFVNGFITFLILDFILGIVWRTISRIGQKKYPGLWIWEIK